MKNFIFLNFISFVLGPVSLVYAQSIVSFKNDLFAHGKVLEQAYGSDFQRIDYDEMRDVNGRDQIPGQQAKKNRVAALKRGSESSVQIGSVDTLVAGNLENFKFGVIFIHGAGGDKSLGFSDWSFGGNFNRLKNLVVKSGGVYISPSANLSPQGATGIAGITQALKAQNPSAKVILICASAGGIICSELSKNANSANLDGMVLLGSAVNINPNSKSSFFSNKKPVVFAHGSRDPIAPWENFYKTFEALEKKGSPTKFYLYNNGNHGNPIRMIDWYQTLNFLL